MEFILLALPDMVNIATIGTHGQVQVGIGALLFATSLACLWHSGWKSILSIALIFLSLAMIDGGLTLTALIHTNYLWGICFIANAQLMGIIRWFMIKYKLFNHTWIMKGRSGFLISLLASTCISGILVSFI